MDLNLSSPLTEDEIKTIVNNKYKEFKPTSTKYVSRKYQFAFWFFSFLKDIKVSLESWNIQTPIPEQVLNYLVQYDVVKQSEIEGLYNFIRDNHLTHIDFNYEYKVTYIYNKLAKRECLVSDRDVEIVLIGIHSGHKKVHTMRKKIGRLYFSGYRNTLENYWDFCADCKKERKAAKKAEREAAKEAEREAERKAAKKAERKNQIFNPTKSEPQQQNIMDIQGTKEKPIDLESFLTKALENMSKTIVTALIEANKNNNNNNNPPTTNNNTIQPNSQSTNLQQKIINPNDNNNNPLTNTTTTTTTNNSIYDNDDGYLLVIEMYLKMKKKIMYLMV
ncbi:hypothetical protein ACTFIR_011876 [Dictyostelium discoideum]